MISNGEKDPEAVEVPGSVESSEPATDSAADASDRTQSRKSSYVAVVYFHGMGQQRRHEEVSRLVDALDTYSGNRYRQGDGAPGILVNIRPRLEPSRIDNDTHDVSYVRVVHSRPEKMSQVRFYEVYWAPVLNKKISVLGVIKWMFATIRRPVSVLLSPWRERQRLRRATLAMMRSTAGAESVPDHDRLSQFYDNFEGLGARREFPEGTFSQFLQYVKRKQRRNPDLAGRLDRLARAWRRKYVLIEVRNLFVLWTTALALITTGVVSVAILLSILAWLFSLGVGAWLTDAGLGNLAEAIEPTVANALALGVSAASLVGLTGFLTTYLGDVQQWVTYEETDEKHQRRHEIIERGVRVLRHVLEDPACARVVVIGHSLGTAVAHDTLLQLTRHNRARNRENPMSGPIALEKIEHLVTLASPIDKIHYLFESFRSDHHRYTRVVDELRGDIGVPPFAKNRKPFVHWVNYWDFGDVISGPLHSPSNARTLGLMVDNVETASYSAPRFASAHSAYFGNRRVISDIFGMIFDRTNSFSNAELVENRGYDYGAQMLGPGRGAPGLRFLVVLLCCLPWLLTAAIVFRLWIPDAPVTAAGYWLLVGSVACLGLAWIFRGRQRYPL